MEAKELFERCRELATSEPSAEANRFMHETLVLCCTEGLKTAGTGFGNLFSQVDYLTKRCGMKTKERMAVQQMRRHSNRQEVLSREAWQQDVRALALLISAVFKIDIPDALVRMIPHHELQADFTPVNARYIRCIVNRFDTQTIWAETTEGEQIEVDYTEHAYLTKIVREGMQLNLLDNHVEEGGARKEKGERRKVKPGIVVVEPDFLIDVSAVARCFQGTYGHHPLLYTVERLKPRGNSQAMLLGNCAGAILDDIINEGTDSQGYQLNDTITQFFREQALQFTTCDDFNAQLFMDDARQQSENIEEAVHLLFDKDYDRRKALLEPSFVCEHLGLQGRVDLMTSDMKLLVEQKSGKNYRIERGTRSENGEAGSEERGYGLHKEEHYVQLLLYYGILRYNFGRSDSQVDIRLLYSRYPAEKGLLYVNFYRELFHEAIRLRNKIVATEMLIAREGFGRILPLLRPDIVFKGAERDGYFHHYVEPPLENLSLQVASLKPIERAYLERMMTFVYREQLLQKTELQEERGGSDSEQWNFRRGDMVYLYNYEGNEPDISKAILHKGTIESINGNDVKVKLNEGESSEEIMQQGPWAIEHAGSDQNHTSAIKSLYQFVSGNAEKRALLLGQRTPREDTTLNLSKSYHKDYDEVLLRAKQARDYFLLVGPPGTGKTSMALRFLVEEELLGNRGDRLPHCNLLLMAYTNRAVDEICAMLEDAGHDYLRISHETSCDPRFRNRLLENILGPKPKLDDIRQRIGKTPIVVGTTSMIQARPFIFQLKHFSLCIIDEASQILEPGLVGVLGSDCIDRFILVGDHKQLPAVVQQSEEESRVDNPLLTHIGITNCRQSLFERLLRWEQHCNRTQFTGILRKQGRMHPEIAAFPNEMFYQKEQLEPVPLRHQTDTSLHYELPSEDEVDDMLKQERVIFIEANEAYKPYEAYKPNMPNMPYAPLSDKANPKEARIVADLLRRIYRFYGSCFDADKTVGVIVPYRNQITMIRQEIEKLGIQELENISIDTVERYQGSQRDVIVYSFTVSRPYQLDFLTSNCFVEDHCVIDRKLNVAITRARKQLIMTGNKEILCQNSIFRQLIARYQKKII